MDEEKLQDQISRLAERTAVTLQRQSDAIDSLHEKVDGLAQEMRSVSGRVAAIEKEPGERWKKISFEIIKYIVLAAVGAAIGYIMKG